MKLNAMIALLLAVFCLGGGASSDALVNAGFNVKAAGNADYDVFIQYAVDQQGTTEDYVVPQTDTYTNPSGWNYYIHDVFQS